MQEPAATSSLPLGALFGIGVAVLIGTIFVVLLLRERNKARARHHHLLSLGYEPIPSPPPDLLERVTELYHREGTQKLRLDHIFRRTILSGEMWIVDLIDTAGDETSSTGAGTMVIVSPDLNLPRLLISPTLGAVAGGHFSPKGRGPSSGPLAKLTSKLIDWAVAKSGLERITFADMPAFDDRYLVLTDDEAAARAALTYERRDRLAYLDRHYEIVTGGDAIGLRPQTYGTSSNTPDLESLDRAIHDAQIIFDYMR